MAEQHGSSGRQLRCVVVTPETTVLDKQADFVALPLYDGELGVAPMRSPLIGRLGHGELRVRDGNQMVHFYVEGGFVEVLNNVVSILTNRAIPASNLDAQIAAEQLQTAQGRPSNSPELMEQRDKAVIQARSQLRIAKRHNS